MTVVEGRFFPATVLFPDGTTWSRVYVVAARGGEFDGLHIWRQPADQAEHYATVNWSKTVIPAPWKARAGFSVHTDNGLIVITPGGGCHCGALARWSGPAWGSTVRAVAR